MTDTFYKQHNATFFKGKHARVLRTLHNGRNDVIRKNSIVIIEKRYGGFGIKSRYAKKSITRVQPKDIELVK